MNRLLQTVASAPPTDYSIIQKRGKHVSVIKPAVLGDKVIILEHLTPIMTAQEREARKHEVEARLFDIFVKYVPK